MKPFLLTFLLAASMLTVHAQELKYNMLDRDYYRSHQPTIKLHGVESAKLQSTYGTEFLVVDGIYMQVYNYASYYRWFFKRFDFLFGDPVIFERFYEKKDIDGMYEFIAARKTQIEMLNRLSVDFNQVPEKNLRSMVYQ